MRKERKVIEISEWAPRGLWSSYLDRLEKAFENLKEPLKEIEICTRTTTLRLDRLELVVSLLLDREGLYAKYDDDDTWEDPQISLVPRPER